jgi:hypothetical protein
VALCPRARSSGGGGGGGIHELWGRCVEEGMALEDGSEVPEVSRRLYLRGAAGVVTSYPSAGTEALARCSAVKQRAIMTVDASGTTASPAVSSHQLRPRHVPATSASSHGPLTAQLTCAVGGPSSFWGAPALRPLKRVRSRAGLPRATVGVLDTGVFRSTCSWASSTAQLRPRVQPRPKLLEKTLMRWRLMRRTTAKAAKDQKTSSRARAGEGRSHVHVSSARLRAEHEDKGRKTAYRPPYPRQGGYELSPCLPKAAQRLLATPPKNSMDGAGRQRKTSASSTHSGGPAPLLYEDYVYRRI